MNKEKNEGAVSLGKLSWAKRTKGMTKAQKAEMMSTLKKGKVKQVISEPKTSVSL